MRINTLEHPFLILYIRRQKPSGSRAMHPMKMTHPTHPPANYLSKLRKQRMEKLSLAFVKLPIHQERKCIS